MSETLTRPNSPEVPQVQNTAETGFGRQLEAGLEKARQQGFDLEMAIRAGYGEDTTGSEAVRQRTEDVLTLASRMAEDMQLKPDFFERPVNTVLLTAIADSWLTNESHASVPSANKAVISRERETLVDIASILAGKQSEAVTDVASYSAHSHDRYIKSEHTQEYARQAEFLAAHVDEGLSEQVQNILANNGEHSFLAEQRKALGITHDNEEKFDVKVLSMGSSTDMFVAQVQEEPNFPDWPGAHSSEEELVEFNRKADVASGIFDANQKQTQKLEDVLDEYEKQFGDSFGDFPEAMVVREEGKTATLFLRAPHALALIKYQNPTTMPTDEENRRYLEEIFGTIRHEYGHTQKDLTLGPHVQLGLLLEERKAEYISGDTGGYHDIKYLFNDLSMALKVNIAAGILDDALKHEDPLSAFTCKGSQKLGLRNTLLLMALKPIPYEKNPDHAKKFADLSSSLRAEDASALDIPVRETLEQVGDATFNNEILEWVREIDRTTGLNEAHDEFVPNYRRGMGLGISAEKLREAVKQVKAEREERLIK